MKTGLPANTCHRTVTASETTTEATYPLPIAPKPKRRERPRRKGKNKMPCSHYLCERYGWHREEWHKEEEETHMEILNHNHPRPNCPACEQVGRWQAEETVRRKLEVAKEMAATLVEVQDNLNQYHPMVKKIQQMISAWPKAGEGRKS